MGRLAQLVERLVYTERVGSSSLSSPTIGTRNFFIFFFLKFFLVFFLLVCLPVRASGIKDYDFRLEVSESFFPWSAVGYLSKPDGLWCTAFLVSKDIAVTAAHCLWDRNGKDFFSPSDINFSLGIKQGLARRFSKIQEIYISPIYFKTAITNKKKFLPYSDNDDWAVLKLVRFLGLDSGYFGFLSLKDLKNVDSQDLLRRVSQVGYSSKNKFQMTVSQGCEISFFLEEFGYSNIHSCRSRSGDSGGPLFVSKNNKIYVVGLHGGRIIHRTKHKIQERVLGQFVPVGDLFLQALAKYGVTGEPYMPNFLNKL